MTTDYAEARKKIEDSNLSPGRKLLALRLLEKQKDETRDVSESRVRVPLSARPSIPVGWLLASVGASGLVGGLCGALIGGVLWP